MEASEISCPLCKSNSYINPGMKIFVSPCYHSLCEMCVSRLFSNGSNKCPECGVTLRKSNYTSQTFEDIEVERECRIRKLMSQHAGKTLEDYSDEEDYNEYLEKIEAMVQVLVELKGPKEITAKLQEFKEALGITAQKQQVPESTKRRKIEKPEEFSPVETEKRKVRYLFPPCAIDHTTIPVQMISKQVHQEQAHYKELIDVMIAKASASFFGSEL
ncbi:CDK-activating kinase assembly factor MAT1 [Nematocida sp. AWRm77]|nr:CDK-activating kinase assembly factor MAT1 [Nematocida sp. AWRm77]